ncbi:B-cell antigen receptor complex-associated protein alpha chain [Garra rufa]|uniref:B-cell antigen receptor complex-associated protein alpha chain n=1 Tax=Garra rufa TaxID=137080 RepID=UPI003CCEB480
MAFKLVIVLCFLAAVCNAGQDELKLEADKPLVRVALSHDVTIKCCYRWNKKPQVTWIKNVPTINGTTKPTLVNLSKEEMNKRREMNDGITCYSLNLKDVQLNDTGLYQCKLNHTSIQIFTHGTFLQVYKTLQKTLNLSESVKNSIITAEGVLLLLCVLLPGMMLLCKSKRLNQLERKKGREEENIYEGLNLDDCSATYHQIQRTSQQGPYQDVGICEEDIQLEKP